MPSVKAKTESHLPKIFNSNSIFLVSDKCSSDAQRSKFHSALFFLVSSYFKREKEGRGPLGFIKEVI
jgi:hypothetical protein